MTTTMQDQSPVGSAREGWTSRVLVREMWAAMAIVAMWVAVLFVGVYGGEMTFHSVDSSWSTIPSVVAVALFAAIGTGSVAKRVFGPRSDK
jgi:Mg/Co/Ni transporter MgtE